MVMTDTNSTPRPDRFPPAFAALPANRLDAFIDRENKPVLDGLPWLRQAQLIQGRDVKTGNVFLLHGLALLQRIARTRRRENVVILAIELDQESDDLERATAMVAMVKGRSEYGPLPEGGFEVTERRADGSLHSYMVPAGAAA
jgi:hypothetical protein